MPQLPQPLYTSQLPQSSSGKTIPEGDYYGYIRSTKLTPTKDQLGQFIEVEVFIPDHNHVITDRLNIINESEKAREIAYSTIRNINEALGIQVLEQTEQWHGHQILVTVGLRVDGQYTNNVIAAYKSAGQPTPPTAAPVQQPQPGMPPAPVPQQQAPPAPGMPPQQVPGMPPAQGVPPQPVPGMPPQPPLPQPGTVAPAPAALPPTPAPGVPPAQPAPVTPAPGAAQPGVANPPF